MTLGCWRHCNMFGVQVLDTLWLVGLKLIECMHVLKSDCVFMLDWLLKYDCIWDLDWNFSWRLHSHEIDTWRQFWTPGNHYFVRVGWPCFPGGVSLSWNLYFVKVEHVFVMVSRSHEIYISWGFKLISWWHLPLMKYYFRVSFVTLTN